MNTTAPTIDRMVATGISKGMISTRARMSHTVTSATPSRHVQGSFVRRLSPMPSSLPVARLA